MDATMLTQVRIVSVHICAMHCGLKKLEEEGKMVASYEWYKHTNLDKYTFTTVYNVNKSEADNS